MRDNIKIFPRVHAILAPGHSGRAAHVIEARAASAFVSSRQQLYPMRALVVVVVVAVFQNEMIIRRSDQRLFIDPTVGLPRSYFISIVSVIGVSGPITCDKSADAAELVHRRRNVRRSDAIDTQFA